MAAPERRAGRAHLSVSDSTGDEEAALAPKHCPSEEQAREALTHLRAAACAYERA